MPDMMLRPSIRPRFGACLALVVCAACAASPVGDKAAIYTDYLIAAANPDATHAGAKILARGGSAMDAAVAAEAVLGLVEPQSSGLGGGAFLLYYDAATKTVTSYDGRETAPAATRGDQFLDATGKPKPFLDQVVGGQSVGVPGTVAMLALAHKAHGHLAWKELLSPAIHLAQDGFTVGARLHDESASLPTLKLQDAARAYLFDEAGDPRAVGTRLRNPAYAQTLRALQSNPRALYEGTIADAIVAAVAHAPKNPQALTAADLAAYRPLERAPVCARYRSYRVCGMGPPSSGGITLLEILGLVERFDLQALGPQNPQSWHLIAEAERLAYADRAQYLADPDFVRAPTAGLLDSEYLKARSQLIDEDQAAAGARAPGTPPGVQQTGGAADQSYELPATTHFTIVDGRGNVAAMTASIEAPFGSQLMAAGFMLNNELTDFSPVPMRGRAAVANAAAPGKRPLSSMAPTIVLDGEGRLVMAVGSPGGKAIIGFVAKTLIAALDWGLTMQAAIDMPNLVNANGATAIEDRQGAAALSAALSAKGHQVAVLQSDASGLHGLRTVAGGYEGAADRRREGTVEGGHKSGKGWFGALLP
jgi:gamma-glutamyltranspeptidase/glutathione hydrolase